MEANIKPRYSKAVLSWSNTFFPPSGPGKTEWAQTVDSWFNQAADPCCEKSLASSVQGKEPRGGGPQWKMETFFGFLLLWQEDCGQAHLSKG